MSGSEGEAWARMCRARSEAMRGLEEGVVRLELGAAAAQLVERHGLIRVAEDLERLAAIYRQRDERDQAGRH